MIETKICIIYFKTFLNINKMNLELLESFGQNFPEDFDGTLDCMSVGVTCQFNRFFE
jgi:hypothetical protein